MRVWSARVECLSKTDRLHMMIIAVITVSTVVQNSWWRVYVVQIYGNLSSRVLDGLEPTTQALTVPRFDQLSHACTWGQMGFTLQIYYNGPGVTTPWQTLGIPSTKTPLSQRISLRPRPFQGTCHRHGAETPDKPQKILCIVIWLTRFGSVVGAIPHCSTALPWGSKRQNWYTRTMRKQAGRL